MKPRGKDLRPPFIPTARPRGILEGVGIKNNTSWGGVARWYGEYLGREDTYQSEVILPNLLRLLGITKGERVLDLACGQGFFTREIAKLGAKVVGADIAPELIAVARTYAPGAEFYVAAASKLSFARNGEFDAVLCVHALQNMEDILSVFTEVGRVLKPSGRFLMVINHPAFRVLKRSSWGWDEAKKIQYRRIDGYLFGAKIAVDMHPGSKSNKSPHLPAGYSGRWGDKKTISYHRSLQDFFKPLAKAGFAVSRLEEWVSHKASGRGPRQKAEDLARKEIPLFMALEARRLHTSR